MQKYVIAKSQCELLLTTKDNWLKSKDDYLSVFYEFEAKSWGEAVDIYEKITEPGFYLSKEECF